MFRLRCWTAEVAHPLPMQGHGDCRGKFLFFYRLCSLAFQEVRCPLRFQLPASRQIYCGNHFFCQVQGADLSPPQAPQNPPCGFPAPGSSTFGSRITKLLKLHIAVTNSRATNRIMLQDYIELLPVDITALASRAQHLSPMTHRNFR